MNCRLWFKEVFAPSSTTIETLEQVARAEADFAILVLTPDDLRDRGIGAKTVARDNVLFELGLFMGALGRGRVFGLKCVHCDIDLPSDLHGVTWLSYLHPHESDGCGSPIDILERLGAALDSAVQAVLSAAALLRPEPIRLAGSPQLVKAYPMRGLISRMTWNDIIRGSTKHLWLHGMSEMGYAEDDSVPDILREAAENDCDIRVLLLDPEYSGIAGIDFFEGNPSGTLAARIRAALARFDRIRADCGPRMKLRVYNDSPMVSIVRGDGQILATL